MGDIEQALMELEESLWRPQTRFDAAYMDDLLAQAFIEFGQSGRIYDRDEILAVAAVDFSTRLPLPDFAVRMISDDVAVVTYRSEVRYGDELVRAHRSSVWRRGDTGWLLEFHQGTPIPV